MIAFRCHSLAPLKRRCREQASCASTPTEETAVYSAIQPLARIAPRALTRLNVRLTNHRALTQIDDEVGTNAGKETGVDAGVALFRR